MLLNPLNATPCKKYKHLLFHRTVIHRASLPLLQLLLLAIKVVQWFLDYIIHAFLHKNKLLL